MDTEKSVFILTQDKMAEKANIIVFILKNYSKDEPCNSALLADKAGLKEAQMHTVIKYMRRCSEKDFEKYIWYYPLSSKKGYFLPKKAEDFASYYITMSAWYQSLQRTVKPARELLIKAGIDLSQYEPKTNDDFYNYLNDIPDMDKDSSWFME